MSKPHLQLEVYTLRLEKDCYPSWFKEYQLFVKKRDPHSISNLATLYQIKNPQKSLENTVEVKI